MSETHPRVTWHGTPLARAAQALVGHHLRIATVVIVVIFLLGSLAACSGLGTGGTGSSANANAAPTSTPTPFFTPTPFPTPTPDPVAAVQQTVTAFCQALSDGNFTQAYSYLTAQYKQAVGSPQQLQNQMPNFGTIAGCMEFGNGGFIQVSGNHASDTVQLRMTGQPFGNTTIPGHLSLVQVGSSWQIDAIGQ
jgi:hypothetical protein